jgi:hypothetical protein
LVFTFSRALRGLNGTPICRRLARSNHDDYPGGVRKPSRCPRTVSTSLLATFATNHSYGRFSHASRAKGEWSGLARVGDSVARRAAEGDQAWDQTRPSSLGPLLIRYKRNQLTKRDLILRCAFDTSAPTIVVQMPPLVADAPVTNPQREAFALLSAPIPEVSETPLPVRTKRKIAKRAPHSRWTAYRPAARAEALPAGW